jgi:hypothetical protein
VLETNQKVIRLGELSKREFKTNVQRKFSEIKETAEKHLNTLTETLNNVMKGKNSRMGQTEERISSNISYLKTQS